jgi:hypothetical protein
MIARHVVTRRLLPALVIVLAVLVFTGCPGVFMISPGGTFTLACFYFAGDMSKLQIVVVFDPNNVFDDGIDYTYTFPVGDYEFPEGSGDVQVTHSFECPDVPSGDYFVYAFLDYDGDTYYEPADAQNDSWVYGDTPLYQIDASGTPYMITSPNPSPNYTVSDTYAAPLQFDFYYDDSPS